jgi:hypothetical protein
MLYHSPLEVDHTVARRSDCTAALLLSKAAALPTALPQHNAPSNNASAGWPCQLSFPAAAAAALLLAALISCIRGLIAP